MKKSLLKATILIYCISTVFFSSGIAMESSEDISGAYNFNVSATDLGVLCLSTSYPDIGIELADSRDNDNYTEDGSSKVEFLEGDNNYSGKITQDNMDSPKVLIVHTHATESYLPSSQSNFHSKDELNTVRDVGNYLEEALVNNGIGVVHDKTLHDYPSYNASYSRSRETVAKLLEKYPSIECVIDLHRDAVASSSPAKVISVMGKTCSKYSYVIGTSAPTYTKNKTFISNLNGIAKKKYQGFTGAVIERGYQYNQDMASKFLLIEIGFNQNRIEDSRNTAAILGEILAEGLKDENLR